MDPHLARELEREMQSDRAEEQAPWQQTSAEWKRLSEDHTPRRLACVQSEVPLAQLQGDLIHYRLLPRDDFRTRWAEHFAAACKAFEDLETRHDRETAHGTIPKVQTQWLERIQRELVQTRAEVR